MSQHYNNTSNSSSVIKLRKVENTDNYYSSRQKQGNSIDKFENNNYYSNSSTTVQAIDEDNGDDLLDYYTKIYSLKAIKELDFSSQKDISNISLSETTRYYTQQDSIDSILQNQPYYYSPSMSKQEEQRLHMSEQYQEYVRNIPNQKHLEGINSLNQSPPKRTSLRESQQKYFNNSQNPISSPDNILHNESCYQQVQSEIEDQLNIHNSIEKEKEQQQKKLEKKNTHHTFSSNSPKKEAALSTNELQTPKPLKSLMKERNRHKEQIHNTTAILKQNSYGKQQMKPSSSPEKALKNQIASSPLKQRNSQRSLTPNEVYSQYSQTIKQANCNSPLFSSSNKQQQKKSSSSQYLSKSFHNLPTDTIDSTRSRSSNTKTTNNTLLQQGLQSARNYTNSGYSSFRGIHEEEQEYELEEDQQDLKHNQQQQQHINASATTAATLASFPKRSPKQNEISDFCQSHHIYDEQGTQSKPNPSKEVDMRQKETNNLIQFYKVQGVERFHQKSLRKQLETEMKTVENRVRKLTSESQSMKKQIKRTEQLNQKALQCKNRVLEQKVELKQMQLDREKAQLNKKKEITQQRAKQQLNIKQAQQTNRFKKLQQASQVRSMLLFEQGRVVKEKVIQNQKRDQNIKKIQELEKNLAIKRKLTDYDRREQSYWNHTKSISEEQEMVSKISSQMRKMGEKEDILVQQLNTTYQMKMDLDIQRSQIQEQTQQLLQVDKSRSNLQNSRKIPPQ